MDIFDNQEFDIDNRDIEEEMFEADVNDEESAEEEKELEESIKYAVKLGKVLNKKNLDVDLTNKCENTRNVYSFKKGKEKYVGYVICKMDKENYIFSIEDSTTESGRKSKKFNINEITQIKD